MKAKKRKREDDDEQEAEGGMRRDIVRNEWLEIKQQAVQVLEC